MNTLIRKGEFMQALDIVKTAVKAVDSKKGENIEVIGITDLTVLTDYFVIATATAQLRLKLFPTRLNISLICSEQSLIILKAETLLGFALIIIRSLYTFFISNSVIFIRLSACGKTAKF